MTDLSQYLCVRSGVINVYIDEKCTISMMKYHCNLFFKNHIRGMKYKVHRGHLICSQVVEFTHGSKLMIGVYVFDNRTLKLISIKHNDNPQTVQEAIELINNRIDHPQNEPLEYTEEETSVTITVNVTIGCFRDSEGFLTNGSVINDLDEDFRSKIVCKAIDNLR